MPTILGTSTDPDDRDSGVASCQTQNGSVCKWGVAQNLMVCDGYEW